MPDTPVDNERVPLLKRLRRLMQFRIRTLLLLTLVAACVMRWKLEPELAEEVTQDGMRIRRQMAQSREAADEGEPTEQQEVADGRYLIIDKHDRVLVRGEQEQGERTGRWRHFHENGRLAMSTRLDESCFSETTRSYDAAGNILSIVGFSRRDGIRVGKWGLVAALSSIQEGELDSLRGEFARRQGLATWRASGDTPAGQGGFDEDRREGPWLFSNDRGQWIARGMYRGGNRHGIWRCRDPRTDRVQSVRFVEGRRIANTSDSQFDRLPHQPAAMSLTELRQLVASCSADTESGRQRFSRLLTSSDPLLPRIALQRIQREPARYSFASPSIRQLARRATGQAIRVEACVAWWAIDSSSPREALRVLGELTNGRGVTWQATSRRIAGLPTLELPPLLALIDDDRQPIRQMACDILYELLQSKPFARPVDEVHELLAWLENLDRLEHDDVRRLLQSFIQDQHQGFSPSGGGLSAF